MSFLPSTPAAHSKFNRMQEGRYANILLPPTCLTSQNMYAYCVHDFWPMLTRHWAEGTESRPFSLVVQVSWIQNRGVSLVENKFFLISKQSVALLRITLTIMVSVMVYVGDCISYFISLVTVKYSAMSFWVYVFHPFSMVTYNG